MAVCQSSHFRSHQLKFKFTAKPSLSLSQVLKPVNHRQKLARACCSDRCLGCARAAGAQYCWSFIGNFDGPARRILSIVAVGGNPKGLGGRGKTLFEGSGFHVRTRTVFCKVTQSAENQQQTG